MEVDRRMDETRFNLEGKWVALVDSGGISH
jgi:hypothetical protein